MAAAQDHAKLRAIVEADYMDSLQQFAEHCGTAHNPRSDGKFTFAAAPAPKPLIPDKGQ